MTSPDLSPYRVLITGGAARVGKVVVDYLAGCNAAVALHYNTSEDSARATQERLQRRGNTCEILQADLRDIDALSTLISAADEAVGPINVLVNNAAIWVRTPFTQVSIESWQDLFETNLRAPFFLAQEFARRAKEREEAQIINMVDVFGRRPLVEYSAYGMTKAALWYMTEVLAAELAPQIRVNGVAPGTVLLNEDHDAHRADELDRAIPMGLSGSPEDVARTIAFLIDGPRYITGEILHVDGARRHIAR